MRLVILALFLLLLVLFALSNTAPVRVGLWATGWSLEAPLSLAILGGMALAFLIGGLLVWIAELRQRRRARRAEQTVRLLEAQMQDLKSRVPPATLGPPVGMTGSRLIVALDTADAARAAGWAAAVAPHCGLFKLGLEFFLANGAAGMRAIAGRPVFLDLKLHDIM